MSNPIAEVEAALNYFGYPIQADMKQCLIDNFTGQETREGGDIGLFITIVPKVL